MAHTHLAILPSYICCIKTSLFTEESSLKIPCHKQPGCWDIREEQKMRKAEEFIPLISVIIWTCGLGGLLPAPFFAEIYKQTNVINQILIITIKKERKSRNNYFRILLTYSM